MFKNYSLKFASPTDETKKIGTLPRVTGICYEPVAFYLTDSRFTILGTLTVRNQVTVTLNVTYSTEVEYLYNDDDEEDAYRYVTHILNSSSLRLDCELVGNDTSPLKVSCAHPIVTEALRTSNFIEQLLRICRDKLIEDTLNNRDSSILQLFLDQPSLTILLFFYGAPVCFDIFTKPLYTTALNKNFE